MALHVLCTCRRARGDQEQAQQRASTRAEAPSSSAGARAGAIRLIVRCVSAPGPSYRSSVLQDIPELRPATTSLTHTPSTARPAARRGTPPPPIDSAPSQRNRWSRYQSPGRFKRAREPRPPSAQGRPERRATRTSSSPSREHVPRDMFRHAPADFLASHPRGAQRPLPRRSPSCLPQRAGREPRQPSSPASSRPSRAGLAVHSASSCPQS